MKKHTYLWLGLVASGLAFAPLASADGPGRGRGNEPAPERPGPPGPGNGRGPETPPPGHGVTPPGRNDNPPPGHGGPNPGRGHAGVSRGQTRVCGAEGPTAVGPEGQAGASHVAHVQFLPPEDSDSESWARLTYFWIGTSFDYVLNAHQLEAGSEWTLVARAADDSAICLGEGTANPGGELHLAETLELDSHLPEDLDPFEPTPEGETPDGTTLELVPSDGVDCEAGSTSSESDDVLTSEYDVRFLDVDEVVCPS